MMNQDDLICKLLSIEDIPDIAPLGQKLNPKLTLTELEAYLQEMFTFSNYYCFGLFYKEDLIGISSGWVTCRFY